MKTVSLFLCVVLLASGAWAQLPENPVPQTSSCTQALFDEDGTLIYVPIDCATIPAWRELPAASAIERAPKTWEEAKGKSPTFVTFRGDPSGDPPLRTNKQVLTSKTFLILHGLLFISLAADNRVTHNAREHWDSEGPAIAGITALDYVMDRFFTRAMSVEGPIYGIQHYVRDALK